MKNKALRCFAVLLMALTASGCDEPKQEAIPTLQLASSSPLNQMLSSATPTASLAAKPSPTIPTSPTRRPTLTNTPRPEPSWTLFPTLLPDEKKAKILELLKHNENCQLPCWWGIVPGNTAWEIARHFLAPFVKDINQGGSDYFIKDNIEYSVTNFSASYEVVEYFDDGITNFGAVRGIVDSIWILPRGTEINYLVYQMLTTYGEPEKVLVEVDVDYGLFHLFLSYPGLGIMALYEGEVEKAESHYEACLQDIGPELWLWSPGKFLGQKDGKPMEPDSVQNMRTIEEATAMTIEDFYQTYRLSDSTCLETPRDLWEAP